MAEYRPHVANGVHGEINNSPLYNSSRTFGHHHQLKAEHNQRSVLLQQPLKQSTKQSLQVSEEQPGQGSMAGVDSAADAVDAPPHRPKQPFLRRGEGVNKRLNAYKLRDEAATLRQERASSSNRSEPQGDQQFDSTSKTAQAGPRQRRTWQLPDQREQELAQIQQLSDGSPSLGGDVSYAATSGRRDSWAAAEGTEDLELEEFRVLEQEIMGGGRHSSPLKGGHTARQQPGGLNMQLPRQQQQDWVQQHEQEDDMLQHSQQQPQQLHGQDWQGSPRQQQGQQQQQQQPYDHAGHDLQQGGLLQSMSLDVRFQDDTEWVDTEFSFAELYLGTQPHPQAHAAAKARTQPPQQQQQLQQPAVEQPELNGMHVADTDGPEAPLSQQPFVRSIFRQQQQQQQQQPQQGRPLSSSSRLGTAASRKGTSRSGKAPPGTSSSAAAAEDGVDADQQMVVVPAAAVARWQQLEASQSSLQQERAALKKMRQDLERAAQQLEVQRAAWEQDKAAQQAALEAWKAEEDKQLANRRRVLDQQYKAMYKLPTKKEKSALEAIEAELERERADAKAAAARHKLTVERLRCQVKQLQDRNTQLHEEVRWHEAQQLNSTDFAIRDGKARRRPTCSSQTQTDTVLSQPAHASHNWQQQADSWAAAAAAGPRSPAGAKQSNALYAALFGDDEDEEEQAQLGDQGTTAWHNQQQQQGSRSRAVAGGVAEGEAAAHGAHAGANGSIPGGSRAPAASSTDSRGSDDSPSGPAAAAHAADDFTFAQPASNHGQQQQQMLLRKGFDGNSSSLQGAAGAAGPALGATKPRQVNSKSSSNGSRGVRRNDSSDGGGTGGSRSTGPFNVAREVVGEVVHTDGKQERVFDDGSCLVVFTNGCVQLSTAGGWVLSRFSNGDVKQKWPSGRVDYYYAEMCVWQCTHPDGLEVFHYASSQVEGHWPDGSKEVCFADGAARIVTADGVEHDVTPDLLSAAVREPPPDLNTLLNSL